MAPLASSPNYSFPCTAMARRLRSHTPRRRSTALFTALLAVLVITYNVLRSAPSNDTSTLAQAAVVGTQQGVSTPQHRPQHKFLLLFSGHQVSDYLALINC